MKSERKSMEFLMAMKSLRNLANPSEFDRYLKDFIDSLKASINFLRLFCISYRISLIYVRISFMFLDALNRGRAASQLDRYSGTGPDGAS